MFRCGSVNSVLTAGLTIRKSERSLVQILTGVCFKMLAISMRHWSLLYVLFDDYAKGRKIMCSSLLWTHMQAMACAVLMESPCRNRICTYF